MHGTTMKNEEWKFVNYCSYAAGIQLPASCSYN